jgi:GPH family glycoside/pentoside/hexuronide:cation symporter
MKHMTTDTGNTYTTSLRAKLFYGVGAAAYGIKDNGFAFLLLIYYSQVLGLPQTLVGTGIFLALIVDALSDPIVGSVSDNLRTRWGRRHPFMYFAALPIAILYYFLWSPPIGLSNDGLFVYFLVMAILVRISITFYEIPSSALVAELTEDYHQRTIFMSLRHFFGWCGGLSLSVYAYSVLLVPTEEYPIGVLNPAGYQTYGLVASILMLAAMWLSALGTHRYIPHLKKSRTAAQSNNLRTIVLQTLETLKNKSFAAIFICALFAALAAGLVSALSIYFNTYYWELDNKQIAALVATLFIAAVLSAIIAPILGKRFGKKHAAIGVGLCAALLTPLPYILRSLGLFPDNGTDTLFYALAGFQLVDVTLIIISAILVDSMIADIVEQSELLTGRRSEGIFFAARSFIRKSVSGVGVLLATTILSVINFPTDAVPGAVAPEVIFNLGLLYVPAIFTLYIISIGAIFAYRITRDIHEDNLHQLLDGADSS